MRSRSALASLLLLPAGLLAQSRPQLSDSAGVPVVTNPVPGAGSPRLRLSAEPRLSVGVVEGAPAYQLFRASGGTVLADGSVLVVDGGTQEARVFDRAGKHLRTIGKKGQGPGEFTGISLVGVLPGDSIVLADRPGKRIAVFTREGILARTLAAPEALGIFFDTYGLLADGSISIAGRSIPAPSAPAVVRRPLAVSWLSLRDGSLRPFGEFPGAEIFQVGMTTGPLVFGRGIHAAARGDRIAVGNDDAYSIRLYDGSGRIRLVVREPRGAVKVSAGEWEEAVPPGFRDGSAANSPFKKVYDEQPHLPTRPSWGGWCSPTCLRLDQAGNLWVQEFAANAFGERQAWHAFDRQGKFLGQLDLPPRSFLLDVGADWVLLNQKDEMDVERVMLFGLEGAAGR